MRIVFLLLILGAAGALVACQAVDGEAIAEEPVLVAGDGPELVQAPTATAVPTQPSPQVPTPIATSTTTKALATPPPLHNPPDPQLQGEAQEWGTPLQVLDGTNTGVWQYAPGTFLHPIALEILGETLYLVDGGRVLAIDVEDPAAPQLLLEPGDFVADVRVLEPLDLAPAGPDLLVLDRAGDVYRYAPDQQRWSLDRFDRPAVSSSGHYFVAVDAAPAVASGRDVTRALLETNYKFVQLYGADSESLFNLQERRGVDLQVLDDTVVVLQRELHDLVGTMTRYVDTRLDQTFKISFPLSQPRQLEWAADELLVLDRAGRRLVGLSAADGALLRLLQPPPGTTAVAFDTERGQLLLAGRDRIWLPGKPEQRVFVTSGEAVDRLQAHDLDLLNSLNQFVVPIGGSNITFRDFQLPGAPRHYRLGVHNGIDLYWAPGTAVRAIGDGVVVRADTAYQPPTAQDLATWAADSAALGYTSAEILDNYMGRQVWIEHAPGIVSRYAHLRALSPDIAPGFTVVRGQTIGEVGNSGSPASLESEKADAHLHFELWLGETHLGQYLRPIETRELVEQLFPVSR